MEKDTIVYREIKQEDNPYLATVIRRVMEEFKINKPSTVYLRNRPVIHLDYFKGWNIRLNC